MWHPNVPTKKTFKLHQRALFWGSHFTWKNTRGLPIYLGEHKEPATRSPPFYLENTRSPPGAHQEPTIYLEKHKEPTRSPPFYLEKHEEPTRSPPFYLEKHEEPTRSPPFCLEKHKEPTRSPPFYLEKHKEPNLSPTGKYSNYWEVAEVRKEDCNFATISIILERLASGGVCVSLSSEN